MAGFIDDNNFNSEVFNFSGGMETSVGYQSRRRLSDPKEINTEAKNFLESLFEYSEHMLTEETKDEREKLERKTKRKRVESPYGYEERKTLVEAFTKVKNITEMLTKLIGENANTKKEIKENVKLLDRAVRKLGKKTEDYIETERKPSKRY